MEFILAFNNIHVTDKGNWRVESALVIKVFKSFQKNLKNSKVFEDLTYGLTMS